jgi:uncharacterized protein (DUF433 family)
MTKIKRILVTLILAAFVGSAGAAAAAVTGGSSTPSTSSPTSTPRHGKHARAGVRVLARALGISAHTIGVSRKDLVAEVRSGKSIAQVAAAHHVDAQAVVDALVKAATDRIDAAKQADKITAAQAAALEQKVKSRAEKFVNATHAPRKLRRAATARKGLGLVAQTIGIDRSQLVSELRSGKTIADVARAHNVDPQKVIDALIKAATERINSAEQAGKINAARAKHLEDTLNGRLEKLVNQWHPRRANTAGPSPSA